MSPHLHDETVKQSLQDALEAAEHSGTRYHIREALQLTELDS